MTTPWDGCQPMRVRRLVVAVALLAGCAHTRPDPRSLSQSDRLRWYRRILVDETREFAKMVGSRDMAPVFEVDHATSHRVQPIPFGAPDAPSPPVPEGDPEFVSRPPLNRLFGMFVVLPGSTAVAPQRAARLAGVLVDPRSYTGTLSGCSFSPSSVVRFRQAANTLDFYFDAGCDDVALLAGGNRVVWHGILSGDATKALRVITEDLEHPSPDEDPEPPDSEDDAEAPE